MSGSDVERRVVDPERPFTGVTYGPAVDDDGYVLTLITADGPLEVEFDEESMYLLWTEVKGTPWPDPPTSTERDLLVKRLVELANGADEELLKDAISALGGKR
ncbi:hypothetical protein HAPG_00087 [Halorubrum phage GNf2]|uniref:hypothetical protein n=1 Tax=Halorubrum sp. GN12_10-3_MGM TaxID=2518113 RepID=UPI0002B79270|nr:hypothetical protein [Halorubrum sp. GN12_10-3_MGM]AGF91272.1 hypothetical protein HAPG_00087 [Halorubrum phage GNf2]TKX64168.1 hypothetical protein EXE47_12365 [Halorubrum sp. GN12_10-3_MGM]